MAVVPDFSAAAADPRVASLKEKCEDARALGIVRVNEDEIMVVYQGGIVYNYYAPFR